MLERSKVGILEPKDGNGISAKYVTTPGEASPSGTCPIPRKEMEAFSLPPSAPARKPGVIVLMRSEEQPSEIQSLMRISYAVLCLKQKKHKQYKYKTINTN